MLARLVLALALAAGALLLVSGPGARFGLWDFPTGFRLLGWAAWLGLAAAACAVVALLVPGVRRAGLRKLTAALLVGLAAGAVPLYWQRVAREAPPIHDISTDLDVPPEFVAVVPLRADAPNPTEHGGAAVAEAQSRAYPEIRPLVLPIGPAVAFERASAEAENSGWRIVASDPAAGRIEATDTTFWFGFKDDVVIRIRADGTGSRIDVRSVSRVGRGDAGTNARRISAYLERLSGQ